VTASLPLGRGQRGEAVRDLQRRLIAAGFGPSRADWGYYCQETEASVSSFQEARGLPADGICDRLTWTALVEASWELGDRTLYLRAPNLRGDDVAELQRQLGRLGFDPGRVDGIFGPTTGAALAEFQRNVELTPADGICGAETVRALHRLSGRAVAGPAVQMVREYERLSHGERTLLGRRVVVGQLGGLAKLARTLARALRVAGSSVLVLDDPDGARQAAAANRFRADVYLGLTTADAGRIAFYATADFESLGGHQLAEQLHDELILVLPVPVAAPLGMRLPVLRETKMPAVLLELGPTRPVVDESPAVAAAVARALARWVAAPVSLDRG
jgi:N-acetylmuramoyl-L-alanine amidase